MTTTSSISSIYQLVVMLSCWCDDGPTWQQLPSSHQQDKWQQVRYSYFRRRTIITNALVHRQRMIRSGVRLSDEMMMVSCGVICHGIRSTSLICRVSLQGGEAVVVVSKKSSVPRLAEAVVINSKLSNGASAEWGRITASSRLTSCHSIILLYSSVHFHYFVVYYSYGGVFLWSREWRMTSW
jgi:hypothetical protein